jgi:hypothetical protein
MSPLCSTQSNPFRIVFALRQMQQGPYSTLEKWTGESSS